jgi:hypothetical protein
MMELLTTPLGSVVISVHDCGSRSIRYDCENSTPCRQFLAGMSTTVAPRKRPLSGVGLIDRNGVGCCLTQPIYGRPRPLVYVGPGSATSRSSPSRSHGLCSDGSTYSSGHSRIPCRSCVIYKYQASALSKR